MIASWPHKACVEIVNVFSVFRNLVAHREIVCSHISDNFIGIYPSLNPRGRFTLLNRRLLFLECAKLRISKNA